MRSVSIQAEAAGLARFVTVETSSPSSAHSTAFNGHRPQTTLGYTVNAHESTDMREREKKKKKKKKVRVNRKAGEHRTPTNAQNRYVHKKIISFLITFVLLVQHYS